MAVAGWYDTVGTLGALGSELAANAQLDRADGSGKNYFAFVRDLWAIHEDEDQKVRHNGCLTALPTDLPCSGTVGFDVGR